MILSTAFITTAPYQVATPETGRRKLQFPSSRSCPGGWQGTPPSPSFPAGWRSHRQAFWIMYFVYPYEYR
ncbi:uncharacterized protein CLUP02_11525 [Colletotrichum lupini]|uniref:Uncharacterized protein n=1 Tax=Colletotrichum lupini TaxID=145971 RepID=A0A9Q8SYR4_9PEZI|nr:uncharacterized protein CLUP02_11525 [Colletotrichum lupini]UQC86026.1 hypothetical protein CLUP02_11525 [Colletotrichum lupini]